MLAITDIPNVFIDHNLWLKPDYLNHESISGNKYRKLKYNLLEAKKNGHSRLLTFGGAYSNHIAAVASAGKEFGFKTIGIIRGEELQDKIKSNATLLFAESCGMQFKFVTRDAYRLKTETEFLKMLKLKFGDFYLLPEGGTNQLAIHGCAEILTKDDAHYDLICCPVGTGGTIAGIINASLPHQKILGFPALKGDFLKTDITKFVNKSNWELITDYHFGGYAEINEELISFINQFKVDFDIPLDPIYTGKMMFGIMDMTAKNKISKETKILAIHTGGLQGIKGMNVKLEQKKLSKLV